MELVLGLVILIYSAIIHEIAHGFVADRLGDPTARIMGRLTLNPIPHIDPIMSVLMPLMLIFSGSPIIFGAAKPVPVDPFNLREGRKDMALVSLAGPLSNFVLAIVGALLFRVLFSSESLVLTVNQIQRGSFTISSSGELLVFVLASLVFMNLLLAIFNLIPIPPLDGSKVFSMVLPEREAGAYLSIGTMGMFIIFILLFFPIGPFHLGEVIFRLIQFGLNALEFRPGF